MPVHASVVPDGPGPGQRLDRYVSETLGLLSRSQLKARLSWAKVNGKAVKPSRRLEAGDRLELSWTEPEISSLEPEDLPLSVLHEDERILVADKAQGMVVHPGAGNPRGTLANAVLFRRLARAFPSAPVPEGAAGLRTGIVHRLDKDTSGVIIAAYDEEALAFLAGQFKARSTRKTYVAVTQGAPREDRGRIETLQGRDPKDRKRFADLPKGGKGAVTDYRVVERFDGYALVALRPKTGRTHQLRVHLKGLGCPILGDPLYGRSDRRFPGATLMLHAYRLRIVLPGRTEPSTFTAPLPERFQRLLRSLRRTGRKG